MLENNRKLLFSRIVCSKINLMPHLVRSLEFVVGRLKSAHNPQPTTYWRKRRLGFTLIEIVLSLFLILGIIAIFLSAAATYISMRNSSLQAKATKIATREVENLRNTAFASLPASGSFSDSELAQLPSGVATRTIEDYQGSDKIKQATITIDWIEKSAPKKILIETLISENGL